MGYSESPRAITDIEPALEPLKRLEPCKWRSEDRRSQRLWAYKVRQALYVARIYPERFPELAKAAKRYSITENKETFETFAVLAAAVPEAQVLHAATTGRPAPIHGTLAPGPVSSFAGATTALEIVEHMTRLKPQNEPVSFPNSPLPQGEMVKLYNWCMKRLPTPYMILRPEDTDSITLLPWDDAAAEVNANWTPESSYHAG